MKKILGIFCHPDDEVLQGWPIFQRDDVEKHLIILCDDSSRNRPERLRALKEVCKQENINLYGTLPEPNNFYFLPTRRAEYLLSHAINNIDAGIRLAIKEIKPDYIFTHNPMGEYGHGSHRLCFELVSQHPSVEHLIFTDMCERSNHRSSNKIPGVIRDAYYHSEFAISENIQALDKEFYIRCHNTYLNHRAWTWSGLPIQTCGLYYLRCRNV